MQNTEITNEQRSRIIEAAEKAAENTMITSGKILNPAIPTGGKKDDVLEIFCRSQFDSAIGQMNLGFDTVFTLGGVLERVPEAGEITEEKDELFTQSYLVFSTVFKEKYDELTSIEYLESCSSEFVPAIEKIAKMRAGHFFAIYKRRMTVLEANEETRQWLPEDSKTKDFPFEVTFISGGDLSDFGADPHSKAAYWVYRATLLNETNRLANGGKANIEEMRKDIRNYKYRPDYSIKLALLWTKLDAMRLEILNEILPLAEYTEATKEEDFLFPALEKCANLIAIHFEDFKLEAVSTERRERK